MIGIDRYQVDKYIERQIKKTLQLDIKKEICIFVDKCLKCNKIQTIKTFANFIKGKSIWQLIEKYLIQKCYFI